MRVRKAAAGFRDEAGHSWSGNVAICTEVSGKAILRVLRSGVRTLAYHDTMHLHPELDIRVKGKRVLRTLRLGP